MRSSDNLVIAHHGAHTCGTTLKMEVNREYGQLDGYTFHKDPGNTEPETCPKYFQEMLVTGVLGGVRGEAARETGRDVR